MFPCHWLLRPLMVIQVAFFAFSFFPEADSYLAISAGRFLMPNYRLWTVFTFSFYNYSVFFLMSDLLTLFLVNNLLSFYNCVNLLKFCAVVNLTTAFSTLCFLYLGYAFTSDIRLLFTEKICGLIGLLGGLTVVGRQTMGDKLLLSFPLGKIRYKHIPFICLIGLVPLLFVRLINWVTFSMFISGIFYAWIYLRFYEKHDNGVVGDVADTFTFSGFFPNHLEPPIAIASNALFNLLLRLKLCKQPIVSVNPPLASVISFTVNVDEFPRPDSKLTSPGLESIAMLVTPESIGVSAH